MTFALLGSPSTDTTIAATPPRLLLQRFSTKSSLVRPRCNGVRGVPLTPLIDFQEDSLMNPESQQTESTNHATYQPSISTHRSATQVHYLPSRHTFESQFVRIRCVPPRPRGKL